jgi:uncharacterized protein
VADDELSAPLGRKTKTKPRRFKLPTAYLPHVMTAALALFVCVCAGWALFVNDPTGGEPVAMVATGFGPPKPAMPGVVSVNPAHGPRSYDGPGGAVTIPVPPPVQAQMQAQPPAPPPLPAQSTRNTVTIIDGSTGNRREVPIPGTQETRAPVEQRLLETSRHGAIPRIAPDGARPAEAYARPLGTAGNKKGAPRIAIVLTGLGVSANLTRQALEQLPGSVTLAFQPYGADVERTVSAARAKGHEVLLQAPMEPFDYPDNDPGPQTLLTSIASDQNMDRLHWLMSRFQGYVGIVNYMGARFTSTEQSLGPILKEAARRGLIFIDDGSSPRSLAPQIASANNLPFAKAEVTLDAVPTAAHIDGALARLEVVARERGLVIGIASTVPASVERIAQWAKSVESRGFVLVPISAVAIKPKSS